MIDSQTARLKALAELETVRADIREMTETLERVELWRPAAGLKKACAEALVMLDQLAERFDRKLVVTLVGPCGSGKSTLLSALAGDEHLSPSGRQRPTTRQVVAFCRQRSDAGQLVDQLGLENIRVQASEAAEALENVILIDTPDTDSTQQAAHIPIIHQAITLSDVLICVFDGENPKRRDHTDFMIPYVRLFNGASLVAVVNKCDRLAEAELTDSIMPEFITYIHAAWSVDPAAVLYISARSHLQQPDWNANTRPRHTLDQFDQLRRLIIDTYNRAGYSVDRRMENARSLRTYLQESIHREAEKEKIALKAAVDQMAAAEAEAMQQAVAAFGGDEGRLASGVNVRLYQQLAQRWLGPVGWLVAIWARILVFGTGVASLLRFGNPVRQIMGAVATVKQVGESKKAMHAADRGAGAGMALMQYDAAMAKAWPDIAEQLVTARFTPRVRDDRQVPGDGAAVGERLTEAWNAALEAELEQAGRRLSSVTVQLLFNLPTLAVLGYAGWLTAMNFFTNTILSSDFFVHAFWTIALVLLLSFFLLQGVIRLAAGRERLVARVFERLQTSLERDVRLAETPVWTQAQRILGLAR